MKSSRSCRLATVVVALLSMLFMQFALASYVCPGQKMMRAAMTVSAHGAQSMPGCEGMDKNQASLCHAHAHDQQAKQSLDKPDMPAVPPFMAVGLIVAVDHVRLDRRLASDFTESLLLERSTAPPISIRHCCFRI